MGGTIYILGGAFVGYAAFVLTARTIRRNARRQQQAAQSTFSFADLQAMKSAGTITPEEFERLKAALLAQGASTEAPPGARGFDVIPSVSKPKRDE